ncbi:MAG TPA: transcriptional repressor [Mycobacteriales bacterium]|jgi:Fur family ferric uptake transcriptional regulator|nr:transcriptional repressor [Mycobacteriales bacterium]
MTTAVRNTRQRSAVAEVLDETDEFRSAQEIHDLLRQRGTPVGLTTVYRTLQAMADAQEVDMMRPPGGDHLYRRCTNEHHHHLVCRSCGTTVEVTGPTVERWAQRIAVEYGFSDIAHTLELFGTCASCATA